MTDESLVAEVAAYVGGVPPTPFLAQCVEVAAHQVAAYVGTSIVPQGVRRRAILEVAAELYHRKAAPNGIKSFADLDGASTVRVARDALVAARPLLAPFMPLATS